MFEDLSIFGVCIHVLLILGDLLIVIAIAHMLRNSRSSTSTIAWLIAIVVIPIVAVPLYLMLGGRKGRRDAMLKEDIAIEKGDRIRMTDPEDSRIDRMLRAHGIPGATLGNRFQLLRTPVEGYQALVEVIESARETLFIEMFIFGHDEVCRDMVQRLARRARDGVEVRLLVDGFGTIKTPRRFFRPLIDAGGHFGVFSPLMRNPLKIRANLRNHRKIAVADLQLCMAGGMNIYREEISPKPIPESWTDLSYLVEGPEVIGYCEIFRSDWGFATGEYLMLDYDKVEYNHLDKKEPDERFTAIGQLVPSGPDVLGDPLYESIMTSVFDARERLWMVTPYFVPDEALGQALRIACNRGVDVRLVVPKQSNHILTDIAGAAFLREVVRAGGSVYRYLPSMLHAKALVMDDHLAMVGSANFDMRSLFLNYELMQFVYSRPEISSVTQWVEGLIEQSELWEPKTGPMREIGEGVVRMLSPVL